LWEKRWIEWTDEFPQRRQDSCRI